MALSLAFAITLQDLTAKQSMYWNGGQVYVTFAYFLHKLRFQPVSVRGDTF